MLGNIEAEHIEVGKGTYIDPTAIIKGINGKAKKISIGDHCYIGASVQILCDNFTLGDYSKIQHHTNIHGYKPCSIGHNAWIGQYSIIDSIGGTTLGNNCGIGAHSQLWSHIKYGDTFEGCRFLEEKPLQIGNDVWFVGHCIVSPIVAADKSMALAGSVITKDMAYNTIYAGAPAKPISEKTGPQFIERTVDEKISLFEQFLKEFGNTTQLKWVTHNEDINWEDEISYFNLITREYKKTGSEIETNFMKFLLPAKAKFTPITK